MSHASGGLYRVLEKAGVYERLQLLLGARRVRHWFANEVLAARPGQRLLDVACGTGSLLDDLPAGIHYVGFDFNPRYIDAARNRHGDRGTFVCGRVEDLRLEEWSGTFDLVVAKGVLHHLDDRSAARLVALAHDALVPGGRLITMDPVRHPEQRWLARLLMALDRGRSIREGEGYLELVRPLFPEATGELFTDLLAVPYSHFAVRGGRS